jgi:hypothetical protein
LLWEILKVKSCERNEKGKAWMDKVRGRMKGERGKKEDCKNLEYEKEDKNGYQKGTIRGGR